VGLRTGQTQFTREITGQFRLDLRDVYCSRPLLTYTKRLFHWEPKPNEEGECFCFQRSPDSSVRPTDRTLFWGLVITINAMDMAVEAFRLGNIY
jgi:hypothetical protein